MHGPILKCCVETKDGLKTQIVCSYPVWSLISDQFLWDLVRVSIVTLHLVEQCISDKSYCATPELYKSPPIQNWSY